MRLLNSDLRWYRDRLIALSACALVALMLAFGLVPTTAHAATIPSCSGLDGSQGPLFFVPSSNSDSTLTPMPTSGSTVAAGSTVYAVYHDETDLGTGHNLTFTYTGPLNGTVTPIFTTLTAGTGFSTMIPAHDDAWIPPPSNLGIHPDQEFNHVVKISGVIPNLTTSGDYLFHLQTFDGDNNSNAGDCGFAEWRLHVKAQPNISTTPSAGGAIGTVIHDTATLSGGQSPTGKVTFKLYAPGDTTCASAIQTFTNEPLSGLTATSGDYTTAAVGTYRWTATFIGDPNNATASSGCQEEQITTTKAQPSIGTTPSAGGPIGTVIHDTATVSGGHSPTGNVTFNLYAPGDLSCESAPVFTDTKALGVASSNYTTAAVGIYRWTATYNGDPNNLTATSGCQDEQVTVGSSEQVAAAAAQQVLAAAVTLPKAGAGPQQQGSSAPGGDGPFGASGIVATLLLALIGSVLFALRRRQSGGAEEPNA